MADVYTFSEDDAKLLKRMIERERRQVQNTRNRPAPIPDIHPAPDVFVVKAPDGGIPALDAEAGTGTGTGTMGYPGSALCNVYKALLEGQYFKLIAKDGFEKRVFNLSESAIPAGSWCLAIRDKSGTWWVTPNYASSSETIYNEISVRITEKSGFTHGFVEQEQLENGTMADKAGGFSGNLTTNTLYERNERTDVPINTTVMAWPGFGWNPRVEIETVQDGNGTIPEIHSVAVLESAGGNFTLAYTSNTTWPFTYQTTGALAWNANATTIETALEGLSNLGNLTITGNGTEADPFLIEHDDNGDHLPLVADYENLVGERLWQFGYTPPSSANTTLDELTVTSILTSENNTIMGGQINVENATTINYEGNNTFYFAAVNRTYNSTVVETYNANLTLNVSGAFGITLCGNTTLCANKTMTLPRIIGNDVLGKLRISSNGTANATLPTAIRVDNASLEMTMIGAPPTPDNGTKGMYWDANGTLMAIDSSGTSTPIIGTGNGTSNGSVGWVQYADGSGGFSADSGVYIDGVNSTIYADAVAIPTLASGPFIVYANSASGELTAVTAIAATYVMFADANGLPTGHADLFFDATTQTLYTETLRVGVPGGPVLIYADANGTISGITGIAPTYVMFADANGLPTGHADLTFDAANGTLYTETLKVGSGGGGDVVTYLDNDGVLQFLANPGTGNFTLHCVNGTLGWF